MKRESPRRPAAGRLVLAAFAIMLFAGPPAASAQGAADASGASRRVAIVMGSNAGGVGRERLRYAASDAVAFSRVLIELGGVRASDLILLVDPSAAAFCSAASRLKAVAGDSAAAGQRCELVMYYSGHSDAEGLLLGNERLGYRELRDALESVNAVVRVAILDSCSSGSLTRSKGGSARPAFLLDESIDMKGHAYITSSSETEAAQESDRLGGSFFTHYLVSALRGAADLSGEGRVTLNEAYAFAFRETLASTENTRYGPQHPAYDISLTGSGDLVFTDLRSAAATLVFSEELEGTVFVRGSGGELVVELDKAAGKRMAIGLPLGAYAISAERGAEKLQAKATLAAGSRILLSRADFKGVASEATAARGQGAGFPVSVNMVILPDFSKGLYVSQDDRALDFGLLWGSARDLRGVQLSTLLNADSGDMSGFQFAGLANAVKGRAKGVQFAAIANMASGGFAGLQFLSLANVARGKSGGAQIGLVNVADRIAGAQIGLVNVSKRIDGAALGLVNIEEGGVLSLEAWWESGNAAFVGFKLGTRYMYDLLSAGVGLVEEGDAFSLGLGLGGHLPIGPFFGDLDISWRVYFDSYGPSSGLEARLLSGFPAKGSGLVVGCAVKGILPGLYREASGELASAFRLEPRFLIGAKL